MKMKSFYQCLLSTWKITLFSALFCNFSSGQSEIKNTPPSVKTSLTGQKQQAIDFATHQIALNQVGYQTQKPKRFTAPLSDNGTVFSVRESQKSTVLYNGSIHNHIGDFSSFQPAESESRYVIELRGGSLKNATSHPFLIRKNLNQEQFWQAAVDFLIDARSVVGTHPSAYGGYPWRDGAHCDTIIPSLAMLYAADSKTIDQMPRQIDWQADKNRINSTTFLFDEKNLHSNGVLDAARGCYELEAPKPDAPDVVKLIYWGASYYLVNPHMRDPDQIEIRAQMVEQVAYVLWAWPSLQRWLPQSFYKKCKDFCFSHWQKSLEISKWWHPKIYLTLAQIQKANSISELILPYKGSHAPGHSIVPNLIMHEVALKEKREDSQIYLNAAINQVEWCIENLDWQDPRTTKGHRMCEHRTIPNLVWFLQKYPQHAPAGLKEKISKWVDVALSRSENLWDFRRFDLESHWTIPKMNDVGNTLGLPACLLAASWVVGPEKQLRIQQLCYASIDHVFGRNPSLATAASKPEMGFPEIERGWPWPHRNNVCARLETCRGCLASLPGSEMYPFEPTAAPRHSEGWVNYGAAWCISLAYLKWDETAKTVINPDPENTSNSQKPGK